jgi:ABC-2 type transport system permease protein
MNFSGFISLLEKEIARYMSVWQQTVMSPIINSLLYILVFGLSLATVMGREYFGFLVTGLVAMSMLNNALQNSASSIISSKFHNDLQDLKVIPVPSVLIAAAYIGAGVVRALMCGLLVFGIGSLTHFLWDGSWITMQNPLLFVVFGLMSAVFFSCVGIWTGFWSASFDQLSVVANFVATPLIYLGGVFFSVNHLSPTWQIVAQWNPLFYMVNGIRWGFYDHGEVSLTRCVLVSFVACLIGIAMAAWGVAKGKYSRF